MVHAPAYHFTDVSEPTVEVATVWSLMLQLVSQWVTGVENLILSATEYVRVSQQEMATYMLVIWFVIGLAVLAGLLATDPASTPRRRTARFPKHVDDEVHHAHAD